MPNPSHNQDLLRLVEPVCAAHGVELVQARLIVEKGQNVLRVFIDRLAGSEGTDEAQKSGVTLEDCTRVSRDLSTVLDVNEELLPAKYRLEVSSPGFERPLTKLAHYQRFAGKPAKIEVSAPISGRRRFTGQVLGVDGDHIRFEQDGTEVVIPFPTIVKGHLVHQF